MVKMPEKIAIKSYSNPCLDLFLNGDELNCDGNISLKTKGIITANKQNGSKVFFNITLKTTTGKKDDLPIYLRFIKLTKIDISEILDYAENGDELIIEQYFPTYHKADINCEGTKFSVGTSK